MEHTCIIGIDVSSRKLDICIKHNGDVTYATIPNTKPALTTWIRAHPMVTNESAVVGLESTGDYHLKAVTFFLDRGFTVKIINPLITRQYIRATIRGTKTDRTDAELICRLVTDGHGEIAEMHRICDEKKELLRLAATIVRCTTQLKLRLANTQRKELAGLAKAERQLKKLIVQAKAVSDSLVDEATAEQSLEEQHVDSIPGFAPKLAAVVVHEIGDIHRFKNAASLVAFAGLDPRVKESGLNAHGRGRITKRGSSYLRCALYLAANIARQFDSELGTYYAKKKAEGRHHTEALCIIARKLVYRIYAVWTEGRPYRRTASVPTLALTAV